MPGHKLKEDIPLEDRGSRIYEALEAIRPGIIHTHDLTFSLSLSLRLTPFPRWGGQSRNLSTCHIPHKFVLSVILPCVYLHCGYGRPEFDLLQIAGSHAQPLTERHRTRREKEG